MYKYRRPKLSPTYNVISFVVIIVSVMVFTFAISMFIGIGYLFYTILTSGVTFQDIGEGIGSFFGSIQKGMGNE